MADTTKKAKDNAKRVTVRLPRLGGANANQDEFMSVNFQNYIVKRGERVEIPEALANMIEDNEKAEDFAMKYAEDKALREPK